MKTEIAVLRKSAVLPDDKKAFIIKIKNMDIDEREIQNTEDQKESYANRAMKYFFYKLSKLIIS